MDAEHIRELFAEFRPVEIRNMFGGAGVAVGGITFGIIFDSVIYLKTDEASLPDFEREGSKPFVYPLMKKPRTRKKPSSFWRLPERLYDEPEELAKWAARALAAAQNKKAVGKRPVKAARDAKPAAKKAVPRKPAAKSRSPKPVAKKNPRKRK
ncbi:MAG: TfoX/Sxy family protein [Xanthobacteraceae bacterium]